MDHLLVADTETAGLKKEEGVVEVAWLEVDDDLNILGDPICARINPPGEVSPGASGVHFITKDMVKDEPTLDEFMRVKMGDRFADKKVCFIGHNIAFDTKYLEDYVGEVHTICTLKLAREAWPKDIEGQPEGYVPPPDHKLPTLMFYLGLTKKGTHNALDDCYTAMEVLKKAMEKLGVDLEQAYKISNTPKKWTAESKLGFGKYAQTKLKDLPPSYIRWALANIENMDAGLRAFLSKM